MPTKRTKPTATIQNPLDTILNLDTVSIADSIGETVSVSAMASGLLQGTDTVTVNKKAVSFTFPVVDGWNPPLKGKAAETRTPWDGEIDPESVLANVVQIAAIGAESDDLDTVLTWLVDKITSAAKQAIRLTTKNENDSHSDYQKRMKDVAAKQVAALMAGDAAQAATLAEELSVLQTKWFAICGIDTDEDTDADTDEDAS